MFFICIEFYKTKETSFCLNWCSGALVDFSFAFSIPDAVKLQASCQKMNSYKNILCNYMTQGVQSTKVRKEERKKIKCILKIFPSKNKLKNLNWTFCLLFFLNK